MHGRVALKKRKGYYVVNQFELAGLKELVLTIDNHAFMTISETAEVLGRFRKFFLMEK